MNAITKLEFSALAKVTCEAAGTKTDISLFTMEDAATTAFWNEVCVELEGIGLDRKEVDRVYTQLVGAAKRAIPVVISDAVVYLPSLMATTIKLNSTSPLSVTVHCHGWREKGKKTVILSLAPCEAELDSSTAADVSRDYISSTSTRKW